MKSIVGQRTGPAHRASAPGLQTGLIVTAAVGNVVQTAANFLSLNSAQAPPEVIAASAVPQL